MQVNRYDPEGLRHELEEDGKLVRFIFRGGEVVAEETEGNIIRLVRGTELLASDADHARTYYHYASDELGSVTHVVTGQERDSADGAEVPEGIVLNRYGYDAWGNLALCEETVPNRFLYAGQQYDPVTRQYYLRARYYNPVIARFTQEDTYRGDGLNLYTYCRNNPVCHVDPSGHCSKDPNGDFMPPAVVPEGKQLPAVYVPQQEALRRWCANFQDDAGTAGRAGTGGNGDFMPPAVIPKQPLPSLDPKRPSLVPEPPRQLPAVIYPQPQDLLDGNPQNRVGGPAADVPENFNRTNGSNFRRIVVTEELIREAMKDAPLKTTQGQVSIPVIQNYVDRVLAGETDMPPIKVAGNVIVDGNHRYITSRITGIDVEIRVWTGSSKPVINWKDVVLDVFDWGNR